MFFWLILVSKSGTKAPTSLTFDNNGTKMFVVGFNGDDINEFTLSAELCPTKLIKVQKYKRKMKDIFFIFTYQNLFEISIFAP